MIARVNVMDRLGRRVPGAAITGKWSGVISSGDTGRTTDAVGTATFYSPRSRTPGSVQFCVVDARAARLSYAPEANAEDCDAVAK